MIVVTTGRPATETPGGWTWRCAAVAAASLAPMRRTPTPLGWCTWGGHRATAAGDAGLEPPDLVLLALSFSLHIRHCLPPNMREVRRQLRRLSAVMPERSSSAAECAPSARCQSSGRPPRRSIAPRVPQRDARPPCSRPQVNAAARVGCLVRRDGARRWMRDERPSHSYKQRWKIN